MAAITKYRKFLNVPKQL